MLSLLGLFLSLAGCGTDSAPEWIALGDQMPSASWSFQASQGAGKLGLSRLDGAAGALWLPFSIRGEEWVRVSRAGAWQVKLGLYLGVSSFANEDAYRVESLGRKFDVKTHFGSVDENQLAFPEGSFIASDDRLVIRLGKHELPPSELTLWVRVPGAGMEAAASIAGTRFSGRGLPVWPGLKLRLPVRVQADASLRFATSLDPLFRQGGSRDLPQSRAPVSYRIRLNGKLLFEHEEASALESSYTWHRVQLPADAVGEGWLEFEVSGPPAYCSFVAPVIGPSDVGRPGQRPWEEAPADMILFLADTYRADNLAIYGGDPDLNQNLNALVPEALSFLRTWSVATYTLPAQSSMFTGVYPYQAGVTSLSNAMPQEMLTLAEYLRAQGYRTGAITDSGILSKEYGFEQGFDWFDEFSFGIESTVERAQAFLDADDGRPMFLFVQSYRAHTPYHGAGDAADGKPTDTLNNQRFADLERELVALAQAEGFPDTKVAHRLPDQLAAHPKALGTVAELGQHYRVGAGVVGDHFAAFQKSLKRDGFLNKGYLIFTSDHGESFGEHGEIYHGNRVFDEETRIPLLLFSDQIKPGSVSHGASLIDLAPTIASLLDLAPLKVWVGRSLLELDLDRPIYSFECSMHRLSTVSMVAGDLKLIAYEDGSLIVDGELHGLFNLEGDPGEQAPLRFDSETKSGLLFEQMQAGVAPFLLPLVGPSVITLSADKEAELSALGYSE